MAYKVQPRGDLIEDLLLQGVVDLQQPVPSPLAGVTGSGGRLFDQHVLGHPPGGEWI